MRKGRCEWKALVVCFLGVAPPGKQEEVAREVRVASGRAAAKLSRRQSASLRGSQSEAEEEGFGRVWSPAGSGVLFRSGVVIAWSVARKEAGGVRRTALRAALGGDGVVGRSVGWSIGGWKEWVVARRSEGQVGQEVLVTLLRRTAGSSSAERSSSSSSREVASGRLWECRAPGGAGLRPAAKAASWARQRVS